MATNRSRIFACALLLCVSGCGGHAAEQSPAPQPSRDDGFGDVVRGIVTDSLVGGGRRDGAVYEPADAASDRLLREAGFAAVPIAGPQRPVCPGSTDATGAPAAAPVGYIVRVHREAGPTSDALQLDVSVRCSFVYHGGGRPFGQGGTWELRLVNGRWRIARLVGDWIT